MTSKQAGRTNTQASQESRESLLQAGAELLSEETQRNPFAAIKMRDLCSRAGLSTGAFYAHWRDARSFHEELAQRLLTDGLAEDFDHLAAVATTAAATAATAGGADAILALAQADLATLLSNSNWDAVELLNVTWARTTLREPAERGYREVDRLTGDTYGIVLEALGREPRPPLTLPQVGAILQALIEGFAFRAKVEPAGIGLAENTGLELYPVAVSTLLVALTRRRSDQASLTDYLAEQMGANARKES